MSSQNMIKRYTLFSLFTEIHCDLLPDNTGAFNLVRNVRSLIFWLVNVMHGPDSVYPLRYCIIHHMCMISLSRCTITVSAITARRNQ